MFYDLGLFVLNFVLKLLLINIEHMVKLTVFKILPPAINS